jgi:hypothetical protein
MGKIVVTTQEGSAEETVQFSCPVCERVMGNKAALTNHIRREHPDYFEEQEA